MTDHHVLLPELRTDDAAPDPGGAAARWNAFPKGREHLLDYASSLVLPTSRIPAERIKSTPNPWARALLFEQALFTKSHPAHEQIRGEWRGMLACLGLAEYLGLQLTPAPLPFDNASPLLDDLVAMLPEELARVWKRVVLLRARTRAGAVLVGGTFPRTLVFTGLRGDLHDLGVPFVRDGRLVDPTVHYRDTGDTTALTVLSRWLTETEKSLADARAGIQRALDGTGGRAEERDWFATLLTQLRAWKDDTEAALRHLGGAEPGLTVETQPSILAGEFPTGDALHPLYAALRVTLPIAEADHVLRVQGKQVIADPVGGVLLRNGQPYNGRLRLPAGQTRDVADGRVGQGVPSDARTGAESIDFARLFEPRLVQLLSGVAGVAVTLRHGVGDEAREYLFPFRREILRYVSAEQLTAQTRLGGSLAGGLVVSLEIPVGGGMRVRYERTYRADAVADDFNAPELVVWPDFETSSWRHYHYATYQLAKRGNRLAIEPAAPADVRVDEDDLGLRWGRLAEAPRAWVVSDVGGGDTRGLLFSAPAEAIRPVPEGASAWDVAIDFGSTQTRVFRRASGDAGAIDEVAFRPRVRQLVGSSERTPYYFFPAPSAFPGGDARRTPVIGMMRVREDQAPTERGVPTLLWLPRNRARFDEAGWLPGDGHIFWGVTIDDKQGQVFGNLKWRREDQGENHAFHAFVTQLFVSIAAEATASGARVGSLVTAYPSVLPGWLRTQHDDQWREVAQRFDVEYRDARSESDAVVEYFVKRHKGKPTTNLLAVDIGGSTSDFAIWYRGKAYVDSIQLAGSIFNALLAKDGEARDAVSAAAASLLDEQIEWAGESDEPRNRILAGLLLRKLGRLGPDGVRKFGKNLYTRGPGSPGERVLAHVAYLYAVVAYTLGLMTARHASEADDNYNVYFAGRGAHLLTWLDAFSPRAGDELVTHFFRAGLAFAGQTQEAEVNVHKPGNDAKEEVGRGLLFGLNGSATAAGVRKDANQFGRQTFVGEECYGAPEARLEWTGDLTAAVLRGLEQPSRRVEVQEMRALQNFVDAFESHPLASMVAQSLGLERQLLNRGLRDLVHERIFGGVWKLAQNKDAARHMVLEPFFVTEAKALLEHVTGNALFEG